jgi:hypothetical protein
MSARADSSPIAQQKITRKRRRSSKKLPSVQAAVDTEVLDVDWQSVADLLEAAVKRKRRKQHAHAEACKKARIRSTSSKR